MILGDLFDSWIGPKQARLPASRAVLESLAERVSKGTCLEIVPGNRDFLMGADVERLTGGRVHPGGFVVDGPGPRALFVHGDELCTRDAAYQRYKRRIQSPLARAVLPWLPLAVLRRIAARLRSESKRVVPLKDESERSIQPAAVRAAAADWDAEVLVCGHAHRWRDEVLADGPRWIILDAWGGPRDTLVVRSTGLEGGEHGSFAACPRDPGPRTLPG